MIAKGIIVGIPGLSLLDLINTVDKYKYSVRIPVFESAGINSQYIVKACLCNYNITLSIGDVVYVGFENNELDRPVILGKLYCSKNIINSIDNIYIPTLDDSFFLELKENVISLNEKIDSIEIDKLLPTISLTSTSTLISPILKNESLFKDDDESTAEEKIEEEIENDKYSDLGYAILYLKISKNEFNLLKDTDEITICAYKKNARRASKTNYPRHKIINLFSSTFDFLKKENYITRNSNGDYIIEFKFPKVALKYSYQTGQVFKTRYIRIRRKVYNANNFEDAVNSYFSNIIKLNVRYDGKEDKDKIPIFTLI